MTEKEKTELEQLREELTEQKLIVGECREMISDAADWMLEALTLFDDSDGEQELAKEKLANGVSWLLGEREAVLRKAKKGIVFTERDVNYINEHLK